MTFTYHADNVKTFDVPRGKAVTHEITEERQKLNLTQRYGCAPQTYCMTCAPQTSNLSIYPLIQKALAATVINTTREDKSRMIIINTGSVRFDLVSCPVSLWRLWTSNICIGRRSIHIRRQLHRFPIQGLFRVHQRCSIQICIQSFGNFECWTLPKAFQLRSPRLPSNCRCLPS